MGLGGATLVDPSGGGTVSGPGGGLAPGARLWTPPGAPAPSAPSAAGPWGSGPATNPLIAASFAPSLRTNRLGLQAAKWEAYNADRPSIVWPLRSPLGTITYSDTVTTLGSTVTDFGGIYYSPHTIPSSIGTDNGRTEAQSSFGAGLVFLSGPGTWWLYSTNAVDCLVIDASNPVVASRYLNDAGYNASAFYTNTNVTAGGGGPISGGQILPANRYRTALLIQQNVNSIGVRLGFGTAPTSDGVSAFTGVRVPSGVNNALLLTGNTAPKTAVFAVTETATAGSITITEWT